MSEVRTVTSQEAREALRGFAGSPSTFLARLANTVATEPDRIRAAVVKTLRDVAGDSKSEVIERADAIENGADL